MTILPELYMLFFSIVFLFMSVGKRKADLFTWAKVLSLVGLVITLVNINASGYMFYGAYRVDLFSQIFKALFAYGFVFVIFMFGKRNEIEDGYLAEYFMFLGFSTLGLMMLVSSVELISIAISLEISSYSLYVIVPLRKSQTKIQLEASMKYLFFGAISSGIMIYGMSYLYGMTQSTFLSKIIFILPKFLDQPIGILAIILTLAGFFFKLSLFPFHFWAPDIYEGASNTTTTFIATVPKVAAAALLIRIVTMASSADPVFVTILIVLAALSMTFGNIVGLVQKDIKRLLGYSGIAHAGYLIMGILAMSKDGNAAAIYYMVVYLFMNLGVFYVVLLLARSGENITLNDLSGLARRAPLLAFTLAVSAFSLAGIPPTGGFTGKLFLFTSAFKAGHLDIVIIGAVNTVISIFYYLNLVRMSYSKEAVVKEPILLSIHEKALCYVLIFVVLYLGVMPFGLTKLFSMAV
ncbi:MAG: NADH-quinone oxidoreductase subunit N [Syntrophorhabdus sp.]|jgi:NADH-quinone oxidoreductase subunit N|nr:NADH-quinone oxidoreductase subunit N [Syntrophorhabdus sp.]MDI9558144.1 NADH-quinone oxidoreductase subunit N [Pseudomonadota bacterium]OPX92773.1 MAG: NADH-quinone oxidoreductase subunit N [Syntrophorhabdus sp. PtaB.Bin027]OQB77859.1 MAG: NADH-quinone oxidoreductase subunit N [Deltaproteobacteria bacterium ADurb.Bin135]NMC93500.1 NADH-quinone oxidoreductase subunit N [Syntrophorhabdus sp.]